ncbi:hypothetical protein D3C73_1143020 [compost metagenome]
MPLEIMMPAASRKDQPNQHSPHTNRLMTIGNRNWPLETKALIRIFAVLGVRGNASIRLGYVPASRKLFAIPAKKPNA